MKCTGKCGRESPDEYDSGQGYGAYTRDVLVEWVCPECWEKGVRTGDTQEAKEKQMENLTDGERAALGAKFVTPLRHDRLRSQVPVVEVFPRQMFLPSMAWCSVFKFTVPLSMVPQIGDRTGRREGRMQSFTMLGAPGGMYGGREAHFSDTYYQVFNIRGGDLVQPFLAVEKLMGFDGIVEVQEVDMKAYENMSQMNIAGRRGLLLKLHAALESAKKEILQAARVYGVIHTLQEAEKLLRWAEHDVEKVSLARTNPPD